MTNDERPESQLGEATPEMAQLIRSCWDKNPAARPNFTEIVSQLEDMQHAAYRERDERLPVRKTYNIDRKMSPGCKKLAPACHASARCFLICVCVSQEVADARESEMEERSYKPATTNRRSNLSRLEDSPDRRYDVASDEELTSQDALLSAGSRPASPGSRPASPSSSLSRGLSMGGQSTATWL